MSTTTNSARIKGKETFARGVHPPERKDSAANAVIEILPTPQSVIIPLLQHIGAPCNPAVKIKDEVNVGDVIGDADTFVTAPVHASIKGTIGRITVTTLPNGRHVPVIPIKAAAEQPFEDRAVFEEMFGGEWPTTGLDSIKPPDIVDAVRKAGLVGLGGAAFPTHVKILRNDKKPIHTLLINGCECEPYLTADYRLMVEAPHPIITGALLAQHAAGAQHVVVCIEDNKPLAIDAIRKAAQGTPLQVRIMKTKYPQGGEKQLISAFAGKEVPTGGLPLDIGFVVLNVGTAAALARAVLRGKPLTHRIITVSGSGIRTPRNLLVPIGVSYRALIDACGGLTENTARVIAGGPMMGFTLSDLDTPVTKGTSGITVLSSLECKTARETTCVRCGRCVDVCPMRLVPTKLALASKAGNLELIKRYSITACMECGSCAYVCPANLPLVQFLRLGKVLLQKEQDSKKN